MPVVVRVMIAAAFCWKEASTDAMAMVWTVGVGLGVRERSSSKTLLWNMAASASKQILLIMDTASTGYLPAIDIVIRCNLSITVTLGGREPLKVGVIER